MSDCIKTYTGKHFVPMEPDIELIDIRDIAHSLSLICRGNGQVKTFFSVAQHCINCAREAIERGHSDRVILACLLHDAGECYLSDVPRPFKQSMPAYRKVEKQLIDLVYQKYLGSKLKKAEREQVQEIDDAMLCFDLIHLLEEFPDKTIPAVHIKLDYSVRPFEEVEEEYLDLFYEYSDEDRPAFVYLEDIADEFEASTGDWDQYLNLDTGEIVSVPSSDNMYIDRTEEDLELLEEIDESDRYVRLWNQYELRERNMMWDFTDLQKGKDAQRLARALNGRRPYRTFKDMAAELGLIDEYYAFRYEQYLKRAEEWCQENEIGFRRKKL